MPASKATRPAQQQSQTSLDVLKKVLTSSSGEVTWEKKELHSVLCFVKLLVSVIVGLVCGILPIVNTSGFLAYGLSTASVSFIFYHSVLQIDEEEFGGHLGLLGEDQNIALPAFVLTWILAFSSVWF